MMSREAMKQALEALESDPISHAWLVSRKQAITALRQALETKREWVGLTDDERHGIREWQRIQEELGPVWAPMLLYLYEAIEAKLKEKNHG